MVNEDVVSDNTFVGSIGAFFGIIDFSFKSYDLQEDPFFFFPFVAFPQQLNDSSVIISCLKTYLINKWVACLVETR